MIRAFLIINAMAMVAVAVGIAAAFPISDAAAVVFGITALSACFSAIFAIRDSND